MLNSVNFIFVATLVKYFMSLFHILGGFVEYSMSLYNIFGVFVQSVGALYSLLKCPHTNLPPPPGPRAVAAVALTARASRAPRVTDRPRAHGGGAGPPGGWAQAPRQAAPGSSTGGLGPFYGCSLLSVSACLLLPILLSINQVLSLYVCPMQNDKQVFRCSGKVRLGTNVQPKLMEADLLPAISLPVQYVYMDILGNVATNIQMIGARH